MTTSYRLLGVGLLLALPTFLFAQKPVPTSALEFGKVPEPATQRLDDRRVRMDNQRPVALYAVGTPTVGQDAEAKARNYLRQARATFGFREADLADLRLHLVREGRAATTVRLRQEYRGVPVHGGELTVSLRPNGQVGFVMNTFLYDINLASVQPQLTGAAARQAAIDYLNVDGNISYEDRELRVAETRAGIRLVWRTVITTERPQGHWEVFVDAQTGEILKAEDTALYAGSHDHEDDWHPPMSLRVSGTGKVFDPDPLSTAGVSYGGNYSDNNDNANAALIAEQRQVVLLDITQSGGQYQLKGPWCEIVDFESPFRGTFSQSSPDWTGDRDDNSFEAVNVYYHIDASMRYLNDVLGINVRPTAYSTGVRVDPSGLNNADNSYYSPGNQRLAFGDGGVDDAEDSDVIHHELGHGLHDWITGGGLSNNQGLSEGSGDYWAVSYNRSLGLWSPGDPQYNWVFNWDGHNQFWNGRVTNISNTYPAGLSGSIHASGQLWATSMMLVWDALGKEKTDLIFWEGIAMTNGGANQNDAAVAVYEAAGNLGYSNEDRMKVHTILTQRGYTLPGFTLPVEWLHLTATPRDKVIDLQWAVSSEVDNDRYTVERSTDGGQSFRALGTLAGAGTAEGNQTYRFTDTAPGSTLNVYRVRQTDFDGTFTYSPLATAGIDQPDEVRLFPNPVAEELIISGLPPADQLTDQVQVLDARGRLVKRVVLNDDVQRVSVAELPAGIYLLRWEENGEVVARRFVKR
ncbi:T9SS type A sorting domain-containing protein [Lewinella sp. W8]|uniref:T9SS type A sorting domain-containing protein n=1 Tax=Lewinella sp. W8 TaxID=2528208 RepID=UPI0010681ABD|nr:T9SS type A sorting domain-containing protein [Lewinella sp. W8]MTB53285.1 T9SS type A sorting domain-containing protein [Lewinella sp. W8]